MVFAWALIRDLAYDLESIVGTEAARDFLLCFPGFQPWGSGVECPDRWIILEA